MVNSLNSKLLLSASLLFSQVTSKLSILENNVSTWDSEIPLITTIGSRDKEWSLIGETGWYRDSTTQELVMELSFIVATEDDGLGPTEFFEDDDVINISWAIPTNLHTDDNVEFEAGVATFFKGASVERTDLPSKKWKVVQTLTKVLNVTQRKIEAMEIIPAQADAIVKDLELGDTDKEKDVYWNWVQNSSRDLDSEIGFKLQRDWRSPTMTIEPGTVIRGRAGLQAYQADAKDSIVFGWTEVEWRFNAESAENRPSGSSNMASGSG